MDIEDLAAALAGGIHQDSAALRALAEKVHVPRPQSLEEVVARGCCMGCGICEGVAGSDFLRMEVVGAQQRMRPVFLQPLPPELEARALAACPGAGVGAAPPEAGVPDDPIVGPVISVRKGHASDPTVRFEAAAAGGLTSLSTFLLESGRVKFVLHVKASVYHGVKEHQGPKLSFTRAEVFEGRGSRYGPVAPLRTIEAVLARNEAFAFVGKPCDVNALRNLALVDPRVDQLCVCMMTLSCGTYADNDAAERMLSVHGIAEDEVAEWRWRGRGCPGSSPYVRAKDGREAQLDYVDYWYKNGGPVGPLTYQWRCKSCPDFLGYQADVVVMDSWPKGMPERQDAVTAERAHEQDGWVLVVARTARGQALVDEAESEGFLRLSSAAVQDVVDTQPHQVKRAVGLLARRLAHAEAGAPQPSLGEAASLRMARAAADPACLRAALGAAADASEEEGAAEARAGFHRKNFEGCRQRLLRGDAAEEVSRAAP